MSFVPPAPLGFVSFAECEKLIADRWESWGCKKLTSSIQLKSFLSGEIEQRLTNGINRAMICCRNTGKFYWVPSKSCRVPVTATPYSISKGDRSPVFAALSGNDIAVNSPERTIRGKAYLQQRDLASCCGADHPPPAADLANFADVVDFKEMNSVEQCSELSKTKNKGGRPDKHDWEKFWIEVAIWTAENDLQVSDRPTLTEFILRWFTDLAPDDAPDKRTIEKRLGLLFERFDRGETRRN